MSQRTHLGHDTRSAQAWQAIRSHAAEWGREGARGEGLEEAQDEGESAYGFAENMMVALLSPPSTSFSLDSDLRILKRAVSILVETVNAGLVREEEAGAMCEFLVRQFLARRIGGVFEALLPAGQEPERAVRGTGGTWDET